MTERKVSVRPLHSGGDALVRFSRDVVNELSSIRGDVADIDTTAVRSRRLDYPTALLWWPPRLLTGDASGSIVRAVESRGSTTGTPMIASNGAATIVQIADAPHSLLGEGCFLRSRAGVRDYLRCETTALPANIASLRVGIWVCPRSYGALGTAFMGRKYNNDATWPAMPISWSLNMTAAGLPQFLCAFTGGGGLQVITGTQALRLGEWAHIAGSYDGATMRLHVNGVVDGVFAIAANVDYGGAPAGGPYFLFNWPSPAANNVEFDGYAEEPLIEAGDVAIGAESYIFKRVMLAKYGVRS